MEAYYSYLNNLVNKVKDTFSGYPELKWINPYNAEYYEQIRAGFIKNLEKPAMFRRTKPFYKQVSKGCELCGKGLWSCLFITGKCNANCFYCPSKQESDDIPSSQGLTFPTAESYAEYINFFNFKGVGFSGGEPLLFKLGVLEYLKKIRAICPSDVYIWMYTNGILADNSIFYQLADAGLNEVRFDIGATNYNLNNIYAAKGIIENITVEIPAIPEEKEKLKALLPDLIKAGVTNLNLHQLRLTKHNVTKLLKRPYTYIPAEKPIVLESELMALEIVEYAQANELDIGINYCSFFFKNRFQSAGFKKQVTQALASPGEIITEKGFIRKRKNNHISYESIKIQDDNTHNLEGSQTLHLKHKTYNVLRNSVFQSPVPNHGTDDYLSKFLEEAPNDIPCDKFFFDIWLHEYIERGLREY